MGGFREQEFKGRRERSKKKEWEEIEISLTWVMGGLGGPGAMKATVEAVALFATTGSLIVASTIEMFLRDRTVQTPARKPHYDIVGIILIKKDNQDALWRFLIFFTILDCGYFLGDWIGMCERV